MNDDPSALSPLPTPAAEDTADKMALAQLARHAEEARGAYAPNTERALRADVARFTGWCAQVGLTPLPTSPDTLARYVGALAGRRAPATIRRVVSSVATFHRAAGLPSPAASQAVVLALKRLHRAQGRTQAQASPLTRAPWSTACWTPPVPVPGRRATVPCWPWPTTRWPGAPNWWRWTGPT